MPPRRFACCGALPLPRYGVTVIVAPPAAPENVAVTVVLPACTAVTRPALSTVAMPGSCVAQRIVPETGLPFQAVIAADRRTVSPVGSAAAVGGKVHVRLP